MSIGEALNKERYVMHRGKIITMLVSALLCGHLALAGETAISNVDDDKEKRLEEVEVTENDRRQRWLPTTGSLIFEPLPVRTTAAPSVLGHVLMQLILRPVRIREDGMYEFDDTRGTRAFTSVDIELGIDRVFIGSRRPLAKNGKRTVELPEGIYAITEARYVVFSQVGRAVDPIIPGSQPGVASFDAIDLPKRDIRFCMAERTIAFDIKNGETTDIGRLIIRALDKRYRSKSQKHRPIMGADAKFLPVSAPSFRNKSPEKASAGVIAFEDGEPLCRKSAIRTPGWFTPDELAEAFPKLSKRLEEDS